MNDLNQNRHFARASHGSRIGSFALVLAFLAVFSAESASAQSFQNGGFEADTWIPGTSQSSTCPGSCTPGVCASDWTFLCGVGYGGQVHSGMESGEFMGPTPFGDQFIWVDYNGSSPGPHASIEQTVSGFWPGNPYQLHFSISSEGHGHGANNPINVTWTDTTAHGPFTFIATGDASPGHRWDNWTSHSLTFTPDSSSVTFHFEHLGTNPNGSGVGLDGLSIEGGPMVPFCFGSLPTACPCGNSGAAGHGCENSVSTGGAVLGATGNNSLTADTVVLTSSGELPSALTIFISGPTEIPPTVFGDGLRCTGGHLRRLYVKNAVSGVATAPVGGDPSISARMTALGSPIQAGDTHHYQAYYRDPNEAFCTERRFNISSGIRCLWGP